MLGLSAAAALRGSAVRFEIEHDQSLGSSGAGSWQGTQSDHGIEDQICRFNVVMSYRERCGGNECDFDKSKPVVRVDDLRVLYMIRL